jgi:hypothetical protein
VVLDERDENKEVEEIIAVVVTVYVWEALLVPQFLSTKQTMKFAAACSLAFVASASAFAPAPSASVS